MTDKSDPESQYKEIPLDEELYHSINEATGVIPEVNSFNGTVLLSLRYLYENRLSDWEECIKSHHEFKLYYKFYLHHSITSKIKEKLSYSFNYYVINYAIYDGLKMIYSEDEYEKTLNKILDDLLESKEEIEDSSEDKIDSVNFWT